ncbi:MULTISPECIES: hypothetical protein [Inquilinus]|uniref:Uncharacterized protein n=1 Tax=Inquilinus ginsengisoli TaxID=363840 RepID=A0ABU1JGF2_9PROT|nr:hypothetical protein [Inquilinus ginsengisoli]MDR6287694.1 hypothetical protein [Inquilinus ginsengisoli]
MVVDRSGRPAEPPQTGGQPDPLDGSGAADASDGWHEPDRLTAVPEGLVIAGGRAPKNQSRIVEHLKAVLLAPAGVRHWD